MESTPIYDRLVEEFDKKKHQEQWESAFGTAAKEFEPLTFNVEREEFAKMADFFLNTLLNTFRNIQGNVYSSGMSLEEASVYNHGIMKAATLAQTIFASIKEI